MQTHYLKRIAEALERIACKLETDEQRHTRARLREQERLSTQRTELSGEFDALDEPGDW